MTSILDAWAKANGPLRQSQRRTVMFIQNNKFKEHGARSTSQETHGNEQGEAHHGTERRKKKSRDNSFFLFLTIARGMPENIRHLIICYGCLGDLPTRK